MALHQGTVETSFLQNFLVAKMSSLRILLVRLPFQGASWAPPSPATKSPFPYESFNSREPFFTRQTEIDLSRSQLFFGGSSRRAQKLAKYVIHAMFQCLEAIKTS